MQLPEEPGRMQEVIVDDATRVYKTPKCGWNGMIRRVIQYGFIKMKKPPEFNATGNEQWSGPNGVIVQLMNYAGISGWRQKKLYVR